MVRPARVAVPNCPQHPAFAVGFGVGGVYLVAVRAARKALWRGSSEVCGRWIGAVRGGQDGNAGRDGVGGMKAATAVSRWGASSARADRTTVRRHDFMTIGALERAQLSTAKGVTRSIFPLVRAGGTARRCATFCALPRFACKVITLQAGAAGRLRGGVVRGAATA